MGTTNLWNRIKAMEVAARSRVSCTYEEHRDVLLEILQRRAIPLPPLEDVDLHRTADLWAADGAREGRCFMMLTGDVTTGHQLMARYTPA